MDQTSVEDAKASSAISEKIHLSLPIPPSSSSSPKYFPLANAGDSILLQKSSRWSPRGFSLSRRYRSRNRSRLRAIAYFSIAFVASFVAVQLLSTFDSICSPSSPSSSSDSSPPSSSLRVASLLGVHEFWSGGGKRTNSPNDAYTNDDADESPERGDDAGPDAIENGQQHTNKRIRFPKTKRRLPQCIIIGARKCGTRALLEFLNIHPAVTKAADEVHFFDDDSNYGQGLEWYRRQMPYSFPDQITIEKSPAYFITEQAPHRIYAMNSSIKLLLIVRDPVTRLISDFAQLVANKKTAVSNRSRDFNSTSPSTMRVSIREGRRGREKEQATFEKTVLLPDGRVNINYKAVRISLYSMYFDRWLKLFPKNQIHIVDGDRLVYDPYPEVQKVEQFLGLSHRISRENFAYNETKGFFCVRLLATRDGSYNGGVDHRPQSSPSPAPAAAAVSTQAKCLNESKGRRHPKVDPQVIQTLRRFYAPHNKRFYQMAGHDFGWPEI